MSKLLIFIAIFFAIVFATAPRLPPEIQRLVCTVYWIITDLMPFVALLLLVLAGLAYAMGGFFGAEIKAKATGYAMALITGAIIGFLIWGLGPTLTDALWPGTKELCAARPT